jgi:NAD(P)-dependent dehydrogenase (short-subunit alcohol dehydrogenase family)
MTSTVSPPTGKNSLGSLWWSARHPPADPTASFAGKTVLITGANVGLGFEAAVKFAALGVSTLIFGVRSLEKGKAAKEKIEQTTKCNTNVIQLFQLDMSDFSSVEKFATAVSGKFPTIDAAVLNAGIAPSGYNLSPHGWEMSVQVNVLSTTYLAILLLPKLRATSSTTGKPAHLEIIASTGHRDVNPESVQGNEGILKKVNDEKTFSWVAQYSITKLLVMWSMVHIAAKTSPHQVIVVATCPGLCQSTIGRDFSAPLRYPDTLFKKIFGRTCEEGSRTYVSATLLREEAHGGFWTHDRISP